MKQLLPIGLLLALPLIVAIVIREIGRRALLKDYEEEYDKLEELVKNSPTYMEFYERIRDGFIRIKKYKCRDKEKIDVLERQFHNRFVNGM